LEKVLQRKTLIQQKKNPRLLGVVKKGENLKDGIFWKLDYIEKMSWVGIDQLAPSNAMPLFQMIP